MESEVILDNQMELSSMFIEMIGLEGIVGLISSFIVLVVYFNLTFNATKLHKHAARPGTKILMWSCWWLALFTALMFLFAWVFEFEDEGAFSIMLVVVTTVPFVTGAFGFRKLVQSLIANQKE